MVDNKDIKSPSERISEEIVVEVKAENEASANSEAGYEFVTETIKKKPINKRRFAKKIIQSAGLGIVTGLVACIVFVVLVPIVNLKLHPETVDLVSIPEDEQVETSEENAPGSTQSGSSQSESAASKGQTDIKETVGLEDDKNAAGPEDAAGEKGSSDKSEAEGPEAAGGEKDDLKAGDGEGGQPASDDGNPVSEEADKAGSETSKGETEAAGVTLNKETGIDEYKKLYRELNEVSNVAKRALTKVKGVTDGTDWFKNSYESATVSTGLIVADNGKELLIITNSQKLNAAKEIEVTFCDSRSYKGKIKKSDPNTNLVVVAVLLDDLEDATKNSYAPAELGNSLLPTLPGTPVIALGAPFGIEDSIATGMITSNTSVLEHTDANIRCITTDIYGSTNGSGVIIDLEGKVLGIIFQGEIAPEMRNLVHAYAISDIKSRIEKLSNGQDAAYLGIVGTDVSDYAVKELGVPEGAYVKQVSVDSPAMEGGIQNGDVIVKLGTSDIKSFKDFSDAINKSQPGDMAVITVKRPVKDEYVEFSYEIVLEAFK